MSQAQELTLCNLQHKNSLRVACLEGPVRCGYILWHPGQPAGIREG